MFNEKYLSIISSLYHILYLKMENYMSIVIFIFTIQQHFVFKIEGNFIIILFQFQRKLIKWCLLMNN